MTEADLAEVIRAATVEWWAFDGVRVAQITMCEHIASRILAAGVIVREPERTEIERAWVLFAGCAKEYTGFKAATEKALRAAKLLS